MGRLLFPLAMVWVFGAVFMWLLSFFLDPAPVADATKSEADTIISEIQNIDIDETLDSVTSVVESLTTNQLLRTNQEAIDIIKESESLKLDAYSDQKGNWHIGYGHQADVTAGQTITAEEAENLLREDLEIIEGFIKSELERGVSENAFSAMVSLAYNIGTGNFRGSTVLSETNAGNIQQAADAFLLWNKVDGSTSTHLTNRREMERSLFLKPD